MVRFSHNTSFCVFLKEKNEKHVNPRFFGRKKHIGQCLTNKKIKNFEREHLVKKTLNIVLTF